VLSNLPELLQNRDQTLLFIGIGNVLRTDDGAGVYISHRINEQDHIKVLTVEVSIENYIQKINSYQADNIILIDSVNFNQDPGYYSLVPVSELLDFTTNTHNISLRNISDFLSGNIYILGIQPETIKFGEGLTASVKKSAKEIIQLINTL
jgi:hydrogenase 3 maturation protease